MKRFLPILFLLCALGARAADTYILMTNWNTDISAGANRDVFVKPLLYSNNFPVSPIDTRKYTSDSTSAFYISNQLSGYYQLDIQAPPQTRRLWLRVKDVSGKWTPTLLDFDFQNLSIPPNTYTRDQTDTAIRNATNSLSGAFVSNSLGVATNLTGYGSNQFFKVASPNGSLNWAWAVRNPTNGNILGIYQVNYPTLTNQYDFFLGDSANPIADMGTFLVQNGYWSLHFGSLTNSFWGFGNAFNWGTAGGDSFMLFDSAGRMYPQGLYLGGLDAVDNQDFYSELLRNRFTIAQGYSTFTFNVPNVIFTNTIQFAGTITNNTTGNAATATTATHLSVTDSNAILAQATNSFVGKIGGTMTGSLTLSGGGASLSVGDGNASISSDGSAAWGVNASVTAAGIFTAPAFLGAVSVGLSNYFHNASNLTNGALPDARLSANVPLLNAANTFTASNHIPGAFEGSGILLTNVNASQLATGTVPSARLSLTSNDIPLLDAKKLVTGTLNAAQAGSVTNHSDVKVIGTSPAIGDTWQYDGSNWTNRPIQGYVIDLFESGSTSMSANTTYFFGKMSARLNNTTYGIAQIDIPKAGTIKRVQYKDDISGTLASGEVVNFYIEVNNATDVFNWAFAMTASFTNNVVTGSQAVVAGDTIVLKVATPATWATPATSVRLAAQIYIE